LPVENPQAIASGRRFLLGGVAGKNIF